MCDSPQQRSRSVPATPTKTTIKRKVEKPYDRHVLRMDRNRYALSPSPSSSASSHSNSSYETCLQDTILKDKSLRQYALERTKPSNTKEPIQIPSHRNRDPVRIFRVKRWGDNFYSSLLDWSYNNFICAARGGDLLFYNMTTDSDTDHTPCRVYDFKPDYNSINAIRFSPTNTKIAMGWTDGSLNLYDFYKAKKIKLNVERPHTFRITCMDWYGSLIFTGSKDKKLKVTDSRTLKPAMEMPAVHNEEICGVKANGNLLASGGNDNSVYIYDIRKAEMELAEYRHEAAVKALDWMGSNVLVSGGGSNDRTVKFWRECDQVYREFDTGSQVCSLLVSPNSEEVVTCQGFSLHQVIIWTLQGKRAMTIHAHDNRVLYSALSPRADYVATGAGDDKLKVWKFFEKSSKTDWPESDIR